jgi:hypothetical protein
MCAAICATASRYFKAALGVAQYKLHLLALDPWEPFEKIVDARSTFEILEQSPDRYARSFEYPRTADLSRGAFHCRTLTPIKHA